MGGRGGTIGGHSKLGELGVVRFLPRYSLLLVSQPLMLISHGDASFTIIIR